MSTQDKDSDIEKNSKKKKKKDVLFLFWKKYRHAKSGKIKLRIILPIGFLIISKATVAIDRVINIPKINFVFIFRAVVGAKYRIKVAYYR